MHVSLIRFCSLLMLFLAGTYSTAWGQSERTLRLNLAGVSINKVPFIIAEEEGIYAKNGLDVNQLFTAGSAKEMRRSGFDMPERYARAPTDTEEAPITITGGVSVVHSRGTSAIAGDRVILATTDPITRWHIFAQPGITAAEQLKGKRLGANGPGSMTHFIAIVFARRMGWDPLYDLSIMDDAMHVDVMQKRMVDAFITYEVPHVMALAAGYKPLVDSRPWNVPMAGSGVVTTRSWLLDNRDTARRFIRSLVEAIALFKQNKSVAFEAMEKWYGITDTEQKEWIYRTAAEMPAKPYPEVEGIKRAMQVYDSHEMRKLKAEDFYDSSLIRELDESGFIDSLYQ